MAGYVDFKMIKAEVDVGAEELLLCPRRYNQPN